MILQNGELKSTLESIGFSEKEAVVYLSILAMGKGTVSQISRKASINRTTGYDILDSLLNKGLVYISGKEPKQEYIAESPEKIKDLLENRIKLEKDNLNKAEKYIPVLTSMHNINDRPQVKFYEGIDGLVQVYDDTLSSSETILAYASVEDIEPTIPFYFPEYYKKRAKKGIPIRAIFPDSPEARARATLDKEEIRESLIVPNSFGFHPEINIYDNKVMIASWREKLGIIIESAEIADAMKKIYELAWAESKRLNDKI